MTMMDPVSGWFKVAPIRGDPNSYEYNMFLMRHDYQDIQGYNW